MNSWSDHLELTEDPSAPDLIYLYKYFQIFIYFISQDMTKSRKQAAQAIATLIYIDYIKCDQLYKMCHFTDQKFFADV